MTDPLFLYGTLRHGPLLDVVAGPGSETRQAAQAIGWRVLVMPGFDAPELFELEGATTPGSLISGL